MRRGIAALRLRHQLDAGRRRLAAAMAVTLTLLRNIDPAADAPARIPAPPENTACVFGFMPSVMKVETTNSSYWWSGSLPPLHTTSLTPSETLLPWKSYSAAYLPLIASTFQPAFGIGLAAITPSGICTRILVVADPAQPCGTANTAL